MDRLGLIHGFQSHVAQLPEFCHNTNSMLHGNFIIFSVRFADLLILNQRSNYSPRQCFMLLSTHHSNLSKLT